MTNRPILRLTVLAAPLTLLACSSGPPPRIPAVPNAIYARDRIAPDPAQDSVEVTRGSAGTDSTPRSSEEHVAQGNLARDSLLVVDVAEGGIQPRESAFAIEQQVHMALLREGYRVVDRAAFGAEMRDRAEAASRELGPRIDLPDLMRAAREDPLRADFVLKIRRLRVVSGSSRRVDLAGLPDVQAFLERNPGLEIPTTIQVPTMVAHLDAELTQVDTGRILWIGSVSSDLIDALGEDAKVRIEATRSVNNGDVIANAIRAHNALVASADAGAKEAWRLLGQAYDRGLGNEEIALRREQFDIAAEELQRLATPPAAAEQPWSYDYTSRFEFTEALGEDEETSAPARETLLIRHVVRTLLTTLPTT